MNNKKNKIIILSTLLFLIAIAGATYAFFTAVINNGDQGSSTIIRTGTLRLVYSDNEYINQSGVLPGSSYTKTITVTNEGDVTAYYDLIWVELLNDFVTKSDLVMEITCASDITINCGGLQETPISDSGTDIPILYNVAIEGTEIKTYTVTITFKETGSNQNDNQGKNLSGKIGIIDIHDRNLAMYGYVYDENSSVLPNVVVELHSDPISAVTDANGRYEIPRVPLGDHTLYVKNGDKTSTIMSSALSISLSNTTSVNNNNIQVTQTRKTLNVNINKSSNNANVALVSKPSGTLMGRDGDYHYMNEFYAYNTQIVSISIEDEINIPSNAYEYWDVSEDQNSTVMAYLAYKYSEYGDDYYDLHIQSDYKLYAPTNSGYLFGGDQIPSGGGGMNYNTTDSDIQLMSNSIAAGVSTTIYGFPYVTSINGLNLLDTSNVTNMQGMFMDMIKVSTMDLSSFNTSNVTNMSDMFAVANDNGLDSILTYLNLSSFDTSNVTDMSGMFYKLEVLEELNLSSFDTSSVINMTNMFNMMRYLKTLDLSNFNTANVTNMSYMFSELQALVSLDLSSFDTAKVTDMNSMFFRMESLTSLDIDSFNTSLVTDMSNMFVLTKLSSLNLSHFNTTNVVYMYYMFQNMEDLTSLNISNFNTSNVEDMYGMFWGCSALTSLNVSSFNTSNVEDMSNMFAECSALTSLSLSNFNTASVYAMGSMFEDCSSVTSLNLSNFNTSNVTTMYGMFSGCSALTSLNVSSFDTSDVYGMEFMFSNCSSLTSLNLSNFNTASLTNTSYMFRGTTNLANLDIRSATFASASSYGSMFSETKNNISITVKDSAAQTFINSRLSDASVTSGVVTIA